MGSGNSSLVLLIIHTTHHTPQLLYQEAITHSQLQHPNILPLLGIYRDNEESYPLMILPYLPDGSLESMLMDSQLRAFDASFLTKIVRIARGIVHLHSRKPPIIHGDIHPGNILIDEFRNPVLCDFGRSRIRHEFSQKLSNQEQGGRIRFLAPELLNFPAEGFHSTQESDVFGVAMTYLNAWSGSRPFAEIKNEHRVISVLIKGQRPNKPAQPLVVLDEITKTEFWTLLANMWTHEPAQRPSSGKILERLERIFHKCELVNGGAFGTSLKLRYFITLRDAILSTTNTHLGQLSKTSHR
ncbi:kinase-like protein [Clavulina sp. PMI_390]|nr:kinase-like protein [Clavulina sp. PMI_390]